MTRATRLALAALVAASGGCATPGADTESFRFATMITDSNLKLFQLSYPRPSGPEPLLRSRPNRPERRAPELNEQTLRNILDQRMESSEYCRSGYLLLGRHSGPTTQMIRGECREAATDDDRRRFPNTISAW